MKEIVLIIGGCRSGKSGHALMYAAGMNVTEKVFIATCVPQDREMESRVEKHKKERHRSWKTIECPINIADIILDTSSEMNVVLVDCLTLWISNLMAEHHIDHPQDIVPYLDGLVNAIKKTKSSVIMVTNEVGTGIVPENKMARVFRDLAGMVNQKIAGIANTVVWMVAGIPAHIKKEE